MEAINISARALAEYVYSSGSIEFGIRPQTAMIEGTRAHQLIQKGYHEEDRKEVPLRFEISAEGLLFLVEGRCDGLLVRDGHLVIDEIKSTAGSLEWIEADSYPVHWAQAKCYAYAIALEHALEEIDIQLTYVQRGTNDTKIFISTFSIVELEEFLHFALKVYAPFAKMKLSHFEKKIESAKRLEFPHSAYRQGQRLLAGTVYRSIKEGNTLFANAPTGIGKTISTLFPSIKAIGEGVIDHIFYITARTTTRHAAEDALSLMAANGLHLTSVTITAKDKICFKEDEGCPGEGCPFTEGYYDRINEAILDIYEHETRINRTVLEHYARKHQLCPFEFSLDVAYHADAVICDYNYVYDPRVSLKRLFDEKKKRTALLVDEAHNLADRAREMYSATLDKQGYLAVKRDYKKSNPGLSKAAGKINQYFVDRKKELEGRHAFLLEGVPEDLLEAIKEFADKAEAELVKGQEVSEELLDAFFSAQNFIRTAGFFNEKYCAYFSHERNETSVKLFCLDPSELLRKAGKAFRSKIFFSATLVPGDYFKEMLGAEEEDAVISIPSPFSREQVDVFISPLSTRYKVRDASYSPIAEMVEMLVKERPGNYFCFFPSYLYLKEVSERFNSGEEIDVLIQQSQMTEEERDQFLSNFEAGRPRSLVVFAVMGGIFSEGVDLPGDKLNGVIITGVGLPQLSFERDILKHYYTSNGKNGYDYSYTFPGLVKVLQAGGRLIRSEEDTGTIVLIDDRFLQKKYLNFFPNEWKEFTILD
ncbi:ATP-dependent helicase [Bacillus sp. FJAT-18017]|uniref:ATP-dependent DNA helicase n=1 Tax=Bacillus sp. FJAT-18017 TaxID=1705566 RepID=UPI0006AFDDCE|nr:ATP-dependent DNA helicase [Bacillus sp. FJAT-18017]ALC90406.1 ATP-dependent helicase [Bacillus sp. FJAT-18017]